MNRKYLYNLFIVAVVNRLYLATLKTLRCSTSLSTHSCVSGALEMFYIRDVNRLSLSFHFTGIRATLVPLLSWEVWM